MIFLLLMSSQISVLAASLILGPYTRIQRSPHIYIDAPPASSVITGALIITSFIDPLVLSASFPSRSLILECSSSGFFHHSSSQNRLRIPFQTDYNRSSTPESWPVFAVPDREPYSSFACFITRRPSGLSLISRGDRASHQRRLSATSEAQNL